MFGLSWFDRLVLSDMAQACPVKNQDWQGGNTERFHDIFLWISSNQNLYLHSWETDFSSLMPQRSSHRCLKCMVSELISFPTLFKLPERGRISSSSWLQFWEGRTACYLCGLKEKIQPFLKIPLCFITRSVLLLSSLLASERWEPVVLHL